MTNIWNLYYVSGKKLSHFGVLSWPGQTGTSRAWPAINYPGLKSVQRLGYHSLQAPTHMSQSINSRAVCEPERTLLLKASTLWTRANLAVLARRRECVALRWCECVRQGRIKRGYEHCNKIVARWAGDIESKHRPFLWRAPYLNQSYSSAAWQTIESTSFCLDTHSQAPTSKN